MLEYAIFALWFLWPAGFANATPIFAAVIPGLKKWDAPMDGGRTWRGQPLLGSHKTWRGLLTGMIMGELIFLLQRGLFVQSEAIRNLCGPVDYTQLPIYFGALLGLGALAGDAVESLVKRQRGIKSGQRWMPFDQLDYIAGALFISLPFVVLSLVEYAWIFGLWFGLHLLVSYLGWRTGLKEHPL